MEIRIIETERLNLHAVSPAVLHHLFTTKGRDELKVHFGVNLIKKQKHIAEHSNTIKH
jgi:hypothetical protein